jgi:hypothetical protein
MSAGVALCNHVHDHVVLLTLFVTTLLGQLCFICQLLHDCVNASLLLCCTLPTCTCSTSLTPDPSLFLPLPLSGVSIGCTMVWLLWACISACSAALLQHCLLIILQLVFQCSHLYSLLMWLMTAARAACLLYLYVYCAGVVL